MADVIYPYAYQLAQLDTKMIDYDSAYVHLWQDGEITPTPDTTIAELTAAECDFGGYAKTQTGSPTSAYLLPGGGVAAETGVIEFVSNASTPENMVGGYWIQTAGTPPVLLEIGTFDDPIPISRSGQAVVFVVQETMFVPGS